MKAVILIMLLTVGLQASSISNVHCGKGIFCLKEVSLKWVKMKNAAVTLAALTELSNSVYVYISKSSENATLLTIREELCEDDTFSGFLLNTDLINSTNSCIWTGEGYKTSCSLVPNNYSEFPFSYISSHIWRKKLQNFRTVIGCSEQSIEKAKTASELYICQERCFKGGYDYVTMGIVIISINCAILKLCGIRIA